MSNEEINKNVKLLENPSPALRQLALEKLAPFVNEEVVKQKIIQSLKDSDHEVRTYAEMHPDLYKQACLVEDEIKHKWKDGFGFNDLMKQGRLL